MGCILRKLSGLLEWDQSLVFSARGWLRILTTFSGDVTLLFLVQTGFFLVSFFIQLNLKGVALYARAQGPLRNNFYWRALIFQNIIYTRWVHVQCHLSNLCYRIHSSIYILGYPTKFSVSALSFFISYCSFHFSVGETFSYYSHYLTLYWYAFFFLFII